jgi:hypothetical protein
LIAREHDDLDACLTAFLDRAGDFRTRRILESDKPGENEIFFEEI